MTTISTIAVPPAPAPPAAGPVAAAYARHARRCRALLARLDAALWDHGFDAADEPGNPGFVVELALLEHRLAEALARQTGREVADVERMLEELS